MVIGTKNDSAPCRAANGEFVRTTAPVIDGIELRESLI
jgi:hypothetical protein